MNDLLRNPKDPLHKTGPEAEKELLKAFGQLAHQFPRDVVIGAALDLIVTAIRQEAAKRNRAMELFDRYVGRARYNLLELHYDNLGNRKNIFPYTQNLQVEELIKFEQKF